MFIFRIYEFVSPLCPEGVLRKFRKDSKQPERDILKGPCWRLPLFNHGHVLGYNQIKLMSFALLCTWHLVNSIFQIDVLYFRMLRLWIDFSWTENRIIFESVFEFERTHVHKKWIACNQFKYALMCTYF